MHKLLGTKPSALAAAIANLDERPKIIKPEDTQAAAYSVGFESWLPYAAESLEISKSIKDYFLVPVPIIYSDIPNRNGVAIPKQSLLQWNSELHCCAYQGWKGCPVYLEHDWGDEKTGRKPINYGVIADVTIRPMAKCPHIMKVIALLAIDRTKDQKLAQDIESGKRNSYSMGCMVSTYKCSICSSELGYCMHLNADRGMDFFLNRKNELTFREAWGIHAVEVSSVADPAFGSALGDPKFKY